MSSFIPALFKMDTFLIKVLANVQLILKYTDSPFHGIVKGEFLTTNAEKLRFE